MRARASLILERFDCLRRDHPDRPLIHLPASKRSLTAAAIWDSAAEQRTRLQRSGRATDGLVIYAAGNRPQLFGLWLACRSLGAPFMPVDAGTTLPEIASLAERFGAEHVIVPETPGSVELGATHPYVPGLLRVTPHVPSAPIPVAGAAALKLTSGSTGIPKATFTTDEQLVADTEHITAAMDIRRNDCQMAAIPLSHAYGIGNLVVPLLVHGTPLVLREGFVPHQFAADAERYGATIFPGVPFMFDHFNEHVAPGAWPRRLERLISAGARLDPSIVRAFHRSFGLKIHSFYGTSETGGITFDDSPQLEEDACVGRPLPGVEVTLRPDEAAAPGCGRVHVSGGAVSSGYVGDASEDDGFTRDGFLTGDFGRYTQHGRLVLTGRASSFINVAGRKVQPEEVEAVLRQVPGIVDARVVGRSDRVRGQQIVACLVISDPAPTMMDIRQFCAARLAPYKIPRAIVRLEGIPLTVRGKIDRRRLQDLVDEHLRELPEADVL